MSQPGALRRPVPWGLAVLAAACLVAGTAVPAAGAAAAGHRAGRGPVDVLYAGSLVGLMEQGIGPAYDAETGNTFNGFSGGSNALASEIKGRTQLADVFVSASPSVNASLQGGGNGNWVSWYATFARSPLVLGVNPDSTFASQLESKPWYDVVTEPGFILGRTDPATDPKGTLAVQALDRAADQHHLPALHQLTTDTSHVYPEQGLVGLLQAGQLDAGFFYASEASAAGIHTVPLGGAPLGATYTVTVVDRAPHAAAAKAFVTFLFSRLGRSILRHDGLRLVTPPTVTGARRVPAGLRATLQLR